MIVFFRLLFGAEAIWFSFCSFLAIFTLSKTYAPSIFEAKALKKRKETGDKQ